MGSKKRRIRVGDTVFESVAEAERRLGYNKNTLRTQVKKYGEVNGVKAEFLETYTSKDSHFNPRITRSF